MAPTADKTETVETAPVEDKATGRVQVSTTLSAEEAAAFAELRWTQRHERPADTLRAAVVEYIAAHPIS